MKAARLAVGGVALAAAGGAFLLFNRAPAPVQQTVVQAAPVIETDQVLVAAHDLSDGRLAPGDLEFALWPRSAMNEQYIRNTGPAALEETKDASIRTALARGEPVRRDKLFKGAGFLSAMLPSGRRAVAINIDGRGSITAGNFILPNDRVDVLFTRSQTADGSKAFSSDAYKTQVILKNIKVLAIGPALQEKPGDKTVGGETATLELDPHQAELVLQSQRIGQLSLALRSIKDAQEPAQTVEADPVAAIDNKFVNLREKPINSKDDEKSIVIIRFGIVDHGARK